MESARGFARSAAQGGPTARYRLGLAYYRGRGVARDRARAFELMLQSARSGFVIAEYGVGVSYEEGRGIGQDAANSRRWMQRAADKGLEEAREKLKSLSPASADAAPESDTAMRATKRSNVRAGPGTSYAKVDILKLGERRVIGRSANWFRLQPTPSQPKRYVYAPLLTETEGDEVVR